MLKLSGLGGVGLAEWEGVVAAVLGTVGYDELRRLKTSKRDLSSKHNLISDFQHYPYRALLHIRMKKFQAFLTHIITLIYNI